tara:strand:- start:1961 stop:2575 length:615 start_codon:yes stop_codon:yes gene_type:complete
MKIKELKKAIRDDNPNRGKDLKNMFIFDNWGRLWAELPEHKRVSLGKEVDKWEETPCCEFCSMKKHFVSKSNYDYDFYKINPLGSRIEMIDMGWNRLSNLSPNIDEFDLSFHRGMVVNLAWLSEKFILELLNEDDVEEDGNVILNYDYDSYVIFELQDWAMEDYEEEGTLISQEQVEAYGYGTSYGDTWEEISILGLGSIRDKG